MPARRDYFRLLFVLTLLQMTMGCATVFNSKITSMKIVTTPPGATVVVGDGLATCKTPCVVKLKTEESLPLTATLEGFAKYKGNATRRISGTFWINFAGGVVFYLPPILMGIDYLTGNMWTWRNLSIKMVPVGEEEKEEEPDPAPDEKIVGAIAPPPAPKPAVVSVLPTAAVPVKKAAEEPVSSSIRTQFPKVLVERRVEWFFGAQNASELDLHVECVYQLMENHQGGAEFPLDDAVKLANGQKKEPCQNN